MQINYNFKLLNMKVIFRRYRSDEERERFKMRARSIKTNQPNPG